MWHEVDNIKKYVFNAIAVLIACSVMIVLLSGCSEQVKQPVLYVKDQEMFSFNFSDKEPIQLTERFFAQENKGESNIEESGLGFSAYQITSFSKDNKLVFYPDRVSYDSGFSLYVKETHKPDADGVRIDSNVFAYAVSDNSDSVLYARLGTYEDVDMCDLYIYDFKDKIKVADKVFDADFTSDLKKVFYQKGEEGDAYIWSAETGESKKIASRAELCYMAEDLSYLYYEKEGGLYKYTDATGSEERLVENILRVLKVYSNGESYYVKERKENSVWRDFIEDDFAENDAKMSEPMEPVYPEKPESPSNWWNYDAEYQAKLSTYYDKCDEIEKAYHEAVDEYEQKKRRDRLREELNSEISNYVQYYELYYYDGEKETLLTDKLMNLYNSTADGKAVISFVTYDFSGFTKPTLSEATTADELLQLVRDEMQKRIKYNIAAGANSIAVVQENAQNIQLSSAGDKVFFLGDVVTREDKIYKTGTLYEINIENGIPSEPKVYDENVSNAEIYLNDKNEIVYYKNYNEELWEGDLYIEKNEIDYNVLPHQGTFRFKDGTVYLTDWDDTCGGTLKIHKNGEKIKIADEIANCVISDEGDIYYLGHSRGTLDGELYRYRDGKSEKIDDDVDFIINPNKEKLKGIE